jgi:CheY-like chemotaxis protein
VIFFSAHAGKEEEDQALRAGAVAFLRKPVHRHDFVSLVAAIRLCDLGLCLPTTLCLIRAL